MVSDASHTETDDVDGNQLDVEADGGATPGFDETVLYTVVQDAVKDTLLYMAGTILLVGVAFVLVVAGGLALIRPTSPVGTAFSISLVAIGLYIAATTLELVPPICDWI